MTYREAVEYIKEMENGQSLSDPERLKELWERLENPQMGMKYVMVQGTNGKSSLIACLLSILKSTGYKTGGYVTPETVEIREKIFINGRIITQKDFCGFFLKVREAEEGMREGYGSLTSFELVLTIGLLAWKKAGCRLIVLEESTEGDCCGSVLRPDMIVDCDDLIKERKPEKVRYGLEKQKFTYAGRRDLMLSLTGKYQIENGAGAVEVAERLGELGVTIQEKDMRKGLMQAGCPGRFTPVTKRPWFIADGADNGERIEALRESLEEYFPGSPGIFIVGALRETETEELFLKIGRLAAHVITVTIPAQAKAFNAYELAQRAQPYHPSVTAVDSLEEAVELSFLLADKESIIVACGSVHYLGKIIELVKKRTDPRNLF